LKEERKKSLWLDFSFLLFQKNTRRKSVQKLFDIFLSLSFSSSMPAKPRKAAKFYAVAAGRATGVFRSWDECQRSVNGFSGASFKAFTTSEEAEAFVVRGGGGGVNAASMTTKLPSSSSKRARPSSIAATVAGATGDDSDAPTDAAAGAPSSKKVLRLFPTAR
jgi:hypothetical protein